LVISIFILLCIGDEPVQRESQSKYDVKPLRTCSWLGCQSVL